MWLALVCGLAAAKPGCKAEIETLCPNFFPPHPPNPVACKLCASAEQAKFKTCNLIRADAICRGTGPSPSPNTPSKYYVALNGSDSADGKTRGTAFATVRKCASTAASGSVCFLGGGRYDRDIDAGWLLSNPNLIIAGDPAANIRPILDGSVAIDTAWTKKHGTSCVYQSAALPTAVWQLWATGSSPPPRYSTAYELDGFAPLTPARFPNAKLSDDTVFDGAPASASGRTNGSLLYSTKSSSLGTLTDDGTHKPSLESSGLDMTGLIAVLPLGTMGAETQGVTVTKHTSGSPTFSYHPPPGTVGKGHRNAPFFFEGSCKLLDAEGEWCIDPQTRVVSVWLDGCVHPSTVHMRGKTRSYLLNVTKGEINDGDDRKPGPTLTLKDVVMWGGTISAPQAEVILDHVQWLHPSANRYVLGQSGLTAADAVLDFNSAAGSIRAVNCTLEWSQSIVVLDKLGVDAYFSDCDFARNGYALGLSASLGDWAGSTGLVFQYNTVRLFNSFTGITPGLRATIAYNEFADATPHQDGAGVHVHIHQQNGILLYRNWAHDLGVKAFRFDRVNSPGATWGTNGTVIENIAWRCGAAAFKGDKHVIANNTVFDSSDESGNGATAALFVMMFDPKKKWAIRGENAHTHLDSNAADSIFNVSGRLPGIHVGNVGNVSIRQFLRDPDHHDFRPAPGSSLEHAHAGAFHSADARLWTAGVRGADYLRDRPQ